DFFFPLPTAVVVSRTPSVRPMRFAAPLTNLDRRRRYPHRKTAPAFILSFRDPSKGFRLNPIPVERAWLARLINPASPSISKSYKTTALEGSQARPSSHPIQ